MGAEKLTEKEFRKSIDDCIIGKKDLVKRVQDMDVCAYQPIDSETGKIFCRFIEAVYSCDRGTFYACGKNLVYAEKPKA